MKLNLNSNYLKTRGSFIRNKASGNILNKRFSNEKKLFQIYLIKFMVDAIRIIYKQSICVAKFLSYCERKCKKHVNH